jgi:hypothetical protein
VITPELKQQVRNLLAEHIGNPRKRAARAARAQYIGELLAATMHDGEGIVDREAADWLRRLTELCAPHADVPDVARWYQLETERLTKLLP